MRGGAGAHAVTANLLLVVVVLVVDVFLLVVLLCWFSLGSRHGVVDMILSIVHDAFGYGCRTTLGQLPFVGLPLLLLSVSAHNATRQRRHHQG